MIIEIKTLGQSSKFFSIEAGKFDTWFEQNSSQIGTSTLRVSISAGEVVIFCRVPTVQTYIMDSLRLFITSESSEESAKKSGPLTDDETAVLTKHQFSFKSCEMNN